MRFVLTSALFVGLALAAQRRLTDAERKTVTDKHNEFRRVVAKGQATAKGNVKLPIAGNMKELIYDTSLEDLAFAWSGGCVWNHSSNGGENLFSSQPSSTNFSAVLTTATESWFNEVSQFDSSGVSNFQVQNGVEVGHFTQLIWAETGTIGCAVATCETLKNLAGKDWSFIVCNYAPQGNVISLPIYLSAAVAASNCSAGFVPDDGLCLLASATAGPTSATEISTVSAASSATAVSGSGAVSGSTPVSASSADPGVTPAVKTTTRGCRPKYYQA